MERLPKGSRSILFGPFEIARRVALHALAAAEVIAAADFIPCSLVISRTNPVAPNSVAGFNTIVDVRHAIALRVCVAAVGLSGAQLMLVRADRYRFDVIVIAARVPFASLVV